MQIRLMLFGVVATLFMEVMITARNGAWWGLFHPVNLLFWASQIAWASSAWVVRRRTRQLMEAGGEDLPSAREIRAANSAEFLVGLALCVFLLSFILDEAVVSAVFEDWRILVPVAVACLLTGLFVANTLWLRRRGRRADAPQVAAWNRLAIECLFGVAVTGVGAALIRLGSVQFFLAAGAFAVCALVGISALTRSMRKRASPF